MSAQNLLFSNLPVSSLGLYNSTSQTIQTINSDSNGNINLNSNVIVGNTLQTAGGGSNGSGSITTYNVNAGGSINAYNISASNDLNVSGTGYFSDSCTAGSLGLTNLSSLPTTGTTGQIIFLNGYLYFYNPTNSTYYSITATPLSSPP